MLFRFSIGVCVLACLIVFVIITVVLFVIVIVIINCALIDDSNNNRNSNRIFTGTHVSISFGTCMIVTVLR